MAGEVTKAIEALEDIMERNEIQHWFNTDKQSEALAGLKALKDKVPEELSRVMEELHEIFEDNHDEYIVNKAAKAIQEAVE